jgi:hypothetical protein
MGKVIKDVFVREKSDAEKVLEEIIKQLVAGNITDFIIAARRSLTPEESALPEHGDTESITIQHWYGDTSCIHALGLAVRISHLINAYIDYCQIEDDDDL